MKRILLAAALITAASCISHAQTAAENLAERLGYSGDAKLLIVHADDLGMAHSISAASIKAMETGLVNSASIMVPCPWFSEIAAYARAHPEADFGLHLTLTSEWEHFRWGPVLSKDRVPSLFDPSGYLYRTETEAAAHIDPREAEAEIRAQIDRARSFGIRPTHLDSHMRTLHQNAALFEVLLRVSRETGIPAAIPREMTAEPQLGPLIRPGDVVIDRFISIGPEVPAERWVEYYTDAIRTLEPGVSELIVHIAYDDAEMRAATVNHEAWGSAWRQRDFDFLTSEAFRRLLRDHNVQLITWRELGKVMGKP